VHDLAKEALHHVENGVILVDATAKVLFANRAAEAILADASGLRVERGRLAAGRTPDDGALARAIAMAAVKSVGATIAISRGERRPLVVTAVPAKGDVYPFLHERRSAMLFIKDPERSAGPLLTTFARHFDLTPAQAALAREIVRADGVAAAAARLGIAYATARTHLLNIFHKTGTRRQTELVRLILDWNEQLTMP
jgi:DNA-binding CsgD family transcriptional regulator